MGGHYGPHTWNRRPKRGTQKPKGTMTVQEAGRMGDEIRKAELGHEGNSEMGKKGGEARKVQVGPEGYLKLGHKGGQRVKQLIEEGKRAEGEGAGMSEREDKGKGIGRTKPRH
jgi:uncharacterized protein